MKNLAILIFAAILLSSCGKDNDVNLDQIHGKWYYFSEQRISANGEITIDTLDSEDYYFDFRPDMTFLSTADGEGFYEISQDSVHINVKVKEEDQYERFGFKYRISGNDLALEEGRVTANMKRL
ncbi:hypothetical protein ACFSQ3_14555 [Sphingobacterium corticis]|uniref:Lipocalin-like domain-containing protein n=1 Tax=Sphingobacterium corticis TaxID=1812823 RepID=A0ABW5NNB9_9SPHI